MNFVDVYHRVGLYKGALPRTLGAEGAGRVEAVGPGVTEVKVGDRVAWAMQTGGVRGIHRPPIQHARARAPRGGVPGSPRR